MEILVVAALAGRAAASRVFGQRHHTQHRPCRSLLPQTSVIFELLTSFVRLVRIGVMGKFEQRVGTTRSEKAILQPVNIDDKTLAALTSDFGPLDHFDAYAVFQYLLACELASLGKDSQRVIVYEEIATFHLKNLSDIQLKDQKKLLGLATIFDVIKFGNSRSHPLLVNERPLRIK